MGDRADSDDVLRDHQARQVGQAGRDKYRQGSGAGDEGVWALLDGPRLGVTVTRYPAIVLYGPSSFTSGGIECPLFPGVLISPSLLVRRL